MKRLLPCHAFDGGGVLGRVSFDHLYGGLWWVATGKGIEAGKR